MPESVKCHHCGKPCETPEELERRWLDHRKGEAITMCNPCGGYEHCPGCGLLWENLGEAGEPCPRCEVAGRNGPAR